MGRIRRRRKRRSVLRSRHDTRGADSPDGFHPLGPGLHQRDLHWRVEQPQAGQHAGAGPRAITHNGLPADQRHDRNRQLRRRRILNHKHSDAHIRRHKRQWDRRYSLNMSIRDPQKFLTVPRFSASPPSTRLTTGCAMVRVGLGTYCAQLPAQGRHEPHGVAPWFEERASIGIFNLATSDLHECQLAADLGGRDRHPRS